MNPASFARRQSRAVLLMTALVADEKGKLDETITVGGEIDTIDASSSVADLEAGETITLKELLYGLLLPSGTVSGSSCMRSSGGPATTRGVISSGAMCWK